jgi:hypothetical protein
MEVMFTSRASETKVRSRPPAKTTTAAAALSRSAALAFQLAFLSPAGRYLGHGSGQREH